MTRDELQDQAVKLLENNQKLICQWATGTGKSSIAIKFLKGHPTFRCLIVVPETNNIQNWRDEFRKFDVTDDKVEIICYASIHKYTGTSWNLIVYDEMPHIDTEKRVAACKSVAARYVLALGAVIDDDERYSLESVYGRFETSVVSLRKAMALGILPSPTVNVIHMRLDAYTMDRIVNGRRCSAKDAYDHIQAKVTKAVSDYNANSNNFNKQRMLRAGNERKRFLGALKEDAMSDICQRLKDGCKRFLCFCSSIKQAESLGGQLAFTSKTPTSLKLLDKFNNKEINSLYVVGKLIEGQNLKDIDCGVIGQLGGTQRITVQEIGRILRSDNPVIYIPVFDETKDDSFLYTLTSSIPEECIKHYKL